MPCTLNLRVHSCNLCVGNSNESIMTHLLSTHRMKQSDDKILGLFMGYLSPQIVLSNALTCSYHLYRYCTIPIPIKHNTVKHPCRKKNMYEWTIIFTFTGHISYHAWLPLHLCMYWQIIFQRLHRQYRLISLSSFNSLSLTNSTFVLWATFECWTSLRASTVGRVRA